MSTDASNDDIEVSFAEVAAEDPEESLAHEAEALDAIEDADPTAPEDFVADGQTAYDPEAIKRGPSITSIYGGGPVGQGDDLAP